MRQLLRILFNTLTVLSLILALLVAGLWVRSYFAVDALRLVPINSPEYTQLGSVSRRGQMSFAWAHSKIPERGERFYYMSNPYTGSASLTSLVPWTFGGFGRDAWTDAVYSTWVAILPHWFVLAATLVVPAARLRSHLKPRNRDGHCPTCGYDLRATPDRCPECGAVANGVST